MTTDRMQYIDMDARYKPDVVYFDGLNGLGQGSWWNTLFGKGQAWYARLNEIGNNLAILMAQVNAFGDPLWNAIRKTAQVTQGAPPFFPSHADEVRKLEVASTSIIVTKQHIPSDGAVSAADVTLRTGNSLVSFAKKVAPEVRGDVEREAAKMAQAVSGIVLHSPADVGMEVFEKELGDRAKALGFGIGGTVLLVGGVLLVAMLAKDKLFRSNPRRRSRSRRSSGPDLKQIAVYGGLGYLAYTQILAPKSA